MSEESLSVIALVAALTVLVLMLVGGRLLSGWRKMRKAAINHSERKARRHREETGRQRLQYSRSQQPDSVSDNPKARSESQRQESQRKDTQRQETQRQESQWQDTQRQETQQSEPRRMQTESGATIIDHHYDKRANKIIDDSEGEYVDFTESPSSVHSS
jgi:hypothetical protein